MIGETPHLPKLLGHLSSSLMDHAFESNQIRLAESWEHDKKLAGSDPSQTFFEEVSSNTFCESILFKFLSSSHTELFILPLKMQFCFCTMKYNSRKILSLYRMIFILDILTILTIYV